MARARRAGALLAPAAGGWRLEASAPGSETLKTTDPARPQAGQSFHQAGSDSVHDVDQNDVLSR